MRYVTYTLVNVSTILADPIALPVLFLFEVPGSLGGLGSSRLFVAKNVETRSRRQCGSRPSEDSRSRRKGARLKRRKDAENGNDKKLHHGNNRAFAECVVARSDF